MATPILSPRLLEEGWRKCYSVKAELPYYFNVKTNTSVWTMPTVSDQDERYADVPGRKSPDLPEPSQEVPLPHKTPSSQPSAAALVPPPSKPGTTSQAGERQFRFLLRDTETSARIVSVQMFKGNVYVGIREFFKKPDTGELIPTKKGINLNLDQWSRLKSIVQSIDEAAKTLTCN
ncbi:activated RNA polymerase II transcriptional coactivator p15-like [Ptychodera flava]|uniref:activated RNA polymerase II transcriptional coactivator p15-like n=1 Tax=Ptychodera flava TaxID=63121 RepID=UPI00396A5EA8